VLFRLEQGDDTVVSKVAKRVTKYFPRVGRRIERLRNSVPFRRVLTEGQGNDQLHRQISSTMRSHRLCSRSYSSLAFISHLFARNKLSRKIIALLSDA
jgi:hypothetical protein